MVADPGECEGHDGLHRARLHVEDARAGDAVALDPAGQAIEGAQRPDGVEVAEQQDARSRGTPLEHRATVMIEDSRGAG